jgi:hypothetical protein
VIEMKTSTKLARTAIVAGLAIALATPAVALAAPPTKIPLGLRTAATTPKVAGTNVGANQAARLQLLKDRIAMVLKIRKARFDFAAERINTNIARVASLAGRVQSKGGDVSGVMSRLQAARSALATAKSDEAQAVSLFQAVPGATDKRAAWQAAIAAGKTAGASLRTARQDLKDAAQALKAVIQALKASTAAGTTGTTQ